MATRIGYCEDTVRRLLGHCQGNLSLQKGSRVGEHRSLGFIVMRCSEPEELPVQYSAGH